MFISKKKYNPLILAFSTIISIILLSYFKFSFNNKTNLFNNFEILHNGDLILRCGRSADSFVAYTADKDAEFTHIGIVVYENNFPKIIHAVPHKGKLLKKETIDEFLNPKNASKFAIYRGNFPSETLQNVTTEISDFYNAKIVFDNNYDLKTDDEMYCTELILKAFKNTNINLNIKPKEFDYLFGKQLIIFPSQFTKPPFKKVNMN